MHKRDISIFAYAAINYDSIGVPLGIGMAGAFIFLAISLVCIVKSLLSNLKTLKEMK